ncbi:MAG TPA: hypothetical protein VEZ90_02920, partial [Blastocatellia bacterium]|nr:hypothetical protein [Blastocatellia bacterium]
VQNASQEPAAGKQRPKADTQPRTADPSCDRLQALLLIQQQLDESKKVEDPVKRIHIMLKAADLLWNPRKAMARTSFQQAFALALDDFKQNGEHSRKEGRLIVTQGDQRLVVIEAVARHDAAWAGRLAKQALEETKANNGSSEESKDAPSRDGEGFMSLALSLVGTNNAAAVQFAHSSLGYPANPNLNVFLYRLAGADQNAADSFYKEAFTVYQNEDVSSFLYLSAYPFALPSAVGNPAGEVLYFRPSASFISSPSFQSAFLDALLTRGRRCLDSANTTLPPPSGAYPDSEPEAEHIYIALSELAPYISQFHPEMSDAGANLASTLAASLTPGSSRNASGYLSRERASSDSANYLEKADRSNDPALRDQYFSFAVLNSFGSIPVSELEAIAGKISDPNTRDQVLNWLYFKAALKAVREDEFDDASRYAGKLRALDQRAYVSFEIAAAALGKTSDRARATEILESVVVSASKAPDTAEKARALLGVASLFYGFDHVRALESINDAVKTINKLSNPNLTETSVNHAIEGARFSYYSTVEEKGFDIEEVFKKLSPADPQGTLFLAKSLTDVTLRTGSIMAIASNCLKPETRR